MSQTYTQEASRKVAIGDSIGHSRATAGTLGCFAHDGRGRGMVLVSASSVLAPPGSTTGEYIYSPAPLDSPQPTPRSRIAVLDAFDREVAVASLLPSVDIVGNRLVGPEVPEPFRNLSIREVVALRSLRIGMQVAKLGRTTGFTVGRLTAVETAIEIRVDVREKVWLEGQCMVEGDNGNSFVGPGDAGALVVSVEPFAALGIVIAAARSGKDVIVSPLSSILSRFSLKFTD